MSRRYRVAAATLAVAMIALAACDGADAAKAGADKPPADPENIADKAPPIYLEQTVVFLQGGKPVVEANYRQGLAHCLETPGWRTKPLEADVVGKLGRSFIRTQFDGRRMASRVDAWTYTEGEAPHICQFSPVHTARLTIVEPGIVTRIDLTEHTGETGPSKGVVRYALAAPDSDEATLKAKVVEQLKQQGHGQVADDVSQPATPSSEAGQPCSLKPSSLAEVCMWSGGEQWGFSTDGDAPMDAKPPAFDSIQLRRDPANGVGSRWRTTRMIVGRHSGDDLFAIPSGVAMTAR